MLQIGEGGAVLASFCMVFLNQSTFRNVLCATIWVLWLALGFGTGTRGEMIALILPIVCFFFVRYHVRAQELFKRYIMREYIVVLSFLIVATVLIQIQIRYRDVGFSNISLSDISFKVEGNEMFSTGLIGFYYIPDHHDFFYDRFPGQEVIMPIPNFLFWAAVAPMPRALWTSKPIDPFWAWYNAVFTGRTTVGGGQTEGTTIAEGIVGYWYFRCGIPGVIEGGLFMGWLLGLLERTIYNNNGRPFSFLAAAAGSDLDVPDVSRGRPPGPCRGDRCHRRAIHFDRGAAVVRWWQAGRSRMILSEQPVEHTAKLALIAMQIIFARPLSGSRSHRKPRDCGRH